MLDFAYVCGIPKLYFYPREWEDDREVEILCFLGDKLKVAKSGSSELQVTAVPNNIPVPVRDPTA